MSLLKNMKSTINRTIKDFMNNDDKLYKDKKGLRGEVLFAPLDSLQIDPKTGLSVLGEPIVRQDFDANQILLAGSIYALEKMFGIESELQIDYLNSIMGVDLGGIPITEKYPKDNKICLWTVGVGGCGDNRKDITTVYQQQRQLNKIIPFRVVDEPFHEGTPEYEKYYLMRQEADGRYAYYGKKFKNDPIIKPLWKDAGGDKDGSYVVESDFTSTRITPIEVFAECILVLETVDFREYFELYGEIEDARFNEVGLVSATPSVDETGRKIYTQARQNSCCHFTNDPLHMDKDMVFVYRWYTA